MHMTQNLLVPVPTFFNDKLQLLPTRAVTVHKAAKVVGPRIGGEDVTRLQRQKHCMIEITDVECSLVVKNPDVVSI